MPDPVSRLSTDDWRGSGFGHFLEHAAAVVLGVVLMVIGLALGVTMIMLPVGVVVGMAGVLLVVGGLFARIDKS